MSRRKIHSEKVEGVEVSCQRSIAVKSAEHILPLYANPINYDLRNKSIPELAPLITV
jgi:hypothetical protein